MLVKMSEYFQGNGVSAVLVRTGTTVNTLAPDEVYEVDLVLGAWLVDNRKGVEADDLAMHTRATYGENTVHYGAQAEPELAHDDDLYKAQTGETSGEYEALPDADNEAKTSKPKVTPDEDNKPDKSKRRSKK